MSSQRSTRDDGRPREAGLMTDTAPAPSAYSSSTRRKGSPTWSRLAIGLEGWSTRVAPTAGRRSPPWTSSNPTSCCSTSVCPTCRAPRSRPDAGERATMPIIFLTGRDGHEDRVAGYAAGRRRLRHEAVRHRGADRPPAAGRAATGARAIEPAGRQTSCIDDASVRRGATASTCHCPRSSSRCCARSWSGPGLGSSIGELLRAAAVRGIRVPREFVLGMVESVRRVVNGERRAIVHGDESRGWVLAAA